MSVWKIAAAVVVVALVPSCGASSESAPAGQSCPQGWQAGVLWSTENGAGSELAFVAGDQSVTRRPVPYVGFVPVPGSLEDRSGTEVVMVSNGDQDRGKTHLVTFSTKDCAVTSRQVPEQLVLGVAADRGVTYTTDALVDTGAILRRRDAQGKVTAEVRFRDLVLGKLLVHGDRLYAFGANYAVDQRPTQLLVLDAGTLKQKARVMLPGSQGTVSQAVVRKGKLYYPQTITSEREGTRLGVVELRNLRHSTVDLRTPAPFLVADAGEYLWIGHTFINPGFRKLTDYRWISRYHPESGKVERFDLGIGISGIAVKGSTLYVLGTGGDEDKAKLRIVDLPGMTLRTELELARPGQAGHFYPSTLIVPA